MTCFVFDTLSVTPVVSGPPFGGMVCLQECRDDVFDCSCESAGQSVYGPRISFLGLYNPCQCKTSCCATSSRVTRSLRYAHLWWLFRRVHVLRVTCIIYLLNIWVSIVIFLNQTSFIFICYNSICCTFSSYILIPLLSINVN
jgi:hypothetical protein